MEREDGGRLTDLSDWVQLQDFLGLPVTVGGSVPPLVPEPTAETVANPDRVTR